VENGIKRACPYMIIKGCAAAIAYYQKAFGATVTYQLIDPIDGRIGHAELSIGDSDIFMADEYADFGSLSPDSIGGSPVKMHLDVTDVDAVVASAVAHGGMLLQPIRQEPFGFRKGLIEDPFGYSWFIASKTEDVSADEAQKRWNESVAH
jgi:PhnB protein